MADIGDALGIRGPSLYRHVASKQILLSRIMLGTMRNLIADQERPWWQPGMSRCSCGGWWRRTCGFTLGHREKAFVGNRELDNLEPRPRAQVLALRQQYERNLRGVIERGCELRRFEIPEP
jgi:AcrR family transcriptional regulator